MNKEESNVISLIDDDGNETLFYIVEQTRINGCSYILVTDSEEDEAEAYILKDISADGDEMANFVSVEDEDEFQAVADMFRQMIEDTELQ